MKLLVLCILMSFNFTIFAQSFSFIAVNGDVQYEEKGTWKKPLSGTKLPDGAKIKLGKNAYAALSHQNKQTIELKNEGSYAFNDLQAQANKQLSSITSKYVNYIVNNATARDHINTMSNKGMVYRKLGNNASIFLYQPPAQSFILEDMVTFVWSHNKNIKEYIFVLSNDEKEILQKEIKDTILTLNIQPYNLKPNECYFWKVIPKGHEDLESNEACIKRYSQEQKNTIYQDVQSIQNDLGNTTLAKVVLANYYEDKKLYIEALNLYKQAADSGIQEYVKLYYDFLSKIARK